MTTLDLERRSKRSEILYEALALQLGASAKRARFSSLVLADDAGLVVQSAGNEAISEHLAAISPGLAKMMMPWHGKVTTNRGEVRLTIAPFKNDGNPMYLCATEGLPDKIPKELFKTGLGIVRILSN